MISVDEVKGLMKFTGLIIAFPCGIVLGGSAELAIQRGMNPGSNSLFPFPLFSIPIGIGIWVGIYKAFVVLSDKHISSDNYKVIGFSLIILYVILIAAVLVWGIKAYFMITSSS